jgi:thioester reductase-like protein/FkbH-like protein
MTIDELLDLFNARGVEIEAEGDALRVRARTGVLTPELRAALAEHKEELLSLLRQRRSLTGGAALPLVQVPRFSDLPASFAQERMWIINQLEPDSPSYNVPLALRLAGHLDVDTLERSLNSIVGRHEVLRTTFSAPKGSLRQTIAPHLSLPLTVVDLQDMTDGQRQDAVARISDAESRRPFDLLRGPLVRFKLLRLSEQNHVLLLVWHHIIVDGWSMGIFVGELLKLYRAFMSGASSPLPDLPIQYADFTAWQRGWLQGECLEQQLSYWRRQLAGAPPILELPTDHLRLDKQTHQGATQPLVLSAELSHRLAEFSRQRGVTLFMTLLAGFQLLLCHRTGQTDIVVGTPIANRTRPELEDLIGYFANTIVLRTDLSGDPSFESLLERVKQVASAAYAHQDAPIEKVIAAVQPARASSYSPLFQVLFALVNIPRPRLELPGLEISVLSTWQMPGAARMDLFFELEETDGVVKGLLEYSTDLFDQATITGMLRQYESLLTVIVADPGRRLSELVGTTEHKRPPQEMTLHHLGILCRSMEDGVRQARRFYGASAVGEVVCDARQDARVCLVETHNGVTLELVEKGATPAGPVRVNGPHHACYEVANVERAVDDLIANGAILVSPPTPAVLFDERRVAFVASDLGLIELLETAKAPTRSGLPEPSAAAQSIPIAITATFTAEPLGRLLTFWAHELDIRLQVDFAPYNQVFQQLLDPTSLLSRNSSGLNIVLARFEDWSRFEQWTISPGRTPPGFYEKIERDVRELVVTLKSAAERTATPHLVVLCPPSPALQAAEDRRSFLTRMESTVADELEAVSGVHVVRSSQLLGSYPVFLPTDTHGDELGHIPYTPSFFAALSAVAARHIYALRHAPYKVIVLDCDQTLWRGVCGEDGPDGVVLDGPRKVLQEFMVAQQDRGMLLCLDSKNNEEDVFRVFEHQPSMPLQPRNLVAWRLNWQRKSENLRSLAEELELGAESFIFVDDNPVECAEVKAACPEVLVLQLPEDPAKTPSFLRHVWAFDHLKTTPEDAQRTALYQQDRQRKLALREAPTLRDFLESLELHLQIAEMSSGDVPRVSQLTQRTNQFNATTVRRSEGEVRALCGSGEHRCLTVRVADRFGDYGLVGVVILREAPEALEVETFLLSCRVLGRGVEHQVLNELGRVAASRGRRRVDILFKPSAKNRPAQDFLDGVAPGARPDPVEDGGVFRFDAAACQAVTYLPKPSDHEEPRKAKTKPTTSTKASSELLNHIANDLTSPEQILQAAQSWRGAEEGGRPQVRQQPFVRPRTETERRLSEIWSGLLRVEQVGRNDGFFDLGGSSLLAVELLVSMRDAFHVVLPLSTVLDHPILSDLALIIESAQRRGQSFGVAGAPSIDFDAEQALDPTITPSPAGTSRPPELAAVLLTGSTGFLGGFLLEELLRQTPADIYCLVRSPDAESGLQKIRRNLDRCGTWDDARRSRIIPICGDISLPLLGLPEGAFEHFAARVDVVYHNAALVNFIYPYREFRGPNVLGTQEVLRFACKAKVKPLHFVSTVAVFNGRGLSSDQVVQEADDPPNGEALFGGYAQSKWVAERLVLEARKRGLPVCIYRPGEITGHSRTGASNKDDAFCRLVRGAVQLGKIPTLEMLVEMVPVDYVARAIVHLSQQANSRDRLVHHLVNPRGMTLPQVAAWMNDYGYRVDQVPYARWLEELERLRSSDALYPLLPMFCEQAFDGRSLFETLQARPRFDAHNTREGLEGTDIRCLPPERLLETYFRRLIDEGFLPRPARAGGDVDSSRATR